MLGVGRHGDAVRYSRDLEPPNEPPESGNATEVAPWTSGPKPRVKVYERPQPQLWVYWGGQWQLASVAARQNWADGQIAFQVDVYEPGETSHVTRKVLWAPDSVRAVHTERPQ